MNDFMEDQHRLWTRLIGQTVTGWSGVSWPFDWDDDDWPNSAVCFHPDAKFQQLHHLIIHTAEATFSFRDGQDNDTFFLWIEEEYTGPKRAELPVANLSEMPLGKIEFVRFEGVDSLRDGIDHEHKLDDGSNWRSGATQPQIVEVTMAIEDHEIAIVAAKNLDTFDEGLQMLWSNESVLLFPCAADVELVNWRGTRDSKLTIPVGE